jgi:hypothetical protein
MRNSPGRPLSPLALGLSAQTLPVESRALSLARVDPADIVLLLRCPEPIQRKVLVRCGEVCVSWACLALIVIVNRGGGGGLQMQRSGDCGLPRIAARPLKNQRKPNPLHPERSDDTVVLRLNHHTGAAEISCTFPV